MSTNKEQKLKNLLQSLEPGTVCLASWLETIGISRDLQKRYRKSGWLTSIGTGAFIREGDTINWQGGIFAIQKQANLPIHPGGITALSMQGLAHYVRMQGETVQLFSSSRTLPSWFKTHDWGRAVDFIHSAMLPTALGLIEHEEKTFTISISSPERAILECLYLAPEKMDLVECYQIMEGLTNLRPKLVQGLLTECSSIKVKRLFLYMAEKAGHAWVKFIQKDTIDLGKGDRSIVKGGAYVASYGITVPQELVEQ